MREYKVDYAIEAEQDITEIAQWVAKKASRISARKYIDRIFDEIGDLSFLAGSLPGSKYRLPLMYHPEAKILTVCHRKLTVIFHIDGEYVIVDKILPSSLITY